MRAAWMCTVRGEHQASDDPEAIDKAAEKHTQQTRHATCTSMAPKPRRKP